jgi:2-dehydropantoate 2-reductase
VSYDSILIVGTGALATLFAARISAIGRKVRMLGTWQESIDQLNSRGARVVGEPAYPVWATSDPGDCVDSGLALVLVKAWQTERAGRQLEKCLPRNGLAISLQNGLGNDTLLRKCLEDGTVFQNNDGGSSERSVVVGVTTLGAYMQAPGVVELAGDGPIWLGAHPGSEHTVEVLSEAGFSIEVVENIRSRQWGKVVINAAINPLSAILRVKNGELLSDPATHQIMIHVACEAAAVAQAHGVTLLYPDPVAAVEQVAGQTGENYSSMLRDILRGVSTEVEAINGVIVRLGEQYSVDVHLNRLLRSLVNNQSRLSSAELSDMVR